MESLHIADYTLRGVACQSSSGLSDGADKAWNCLVLTAAASSSQVEVAAYLLSGVPHYVLAALGIEILKAAAFLGLRTRQFLPSYRHFFRSIGPRKISPID
ncbi:hypothetical protein Nepgr_024674 [Nepenthes gracilis]|uniref:Uncharacterized protein n=1 Tax=Nepenthes gracilis TaxID=150966 RepID=A0AAD3Y0R4_NEPGR|nr:hypothetical protein Nepgr_024674 [Nepenthes gracilis]